MNGRTTGCPWFAPGQGIGTAAPSRLGDSAPRHAPHWATKTWESNGISPGTRHKNHAERCGRRRRLEVPDQHAGIAWFNGFSCPPCGLLASPRPPRMHDCYADDRRTFGPAAGTRRKRSLCNHPKSARHLPTRSARANAHATGRTTSCSRSKSADFASPTTSRRRNS
jgi:hypothetical protein